MAPHTHLRGAHPRHLQSLTTHPELLRLLWDKGTRPPETEPWISAFLCCWGQGQRGMRVTVTPASPGEPGGPQRAELHQGWHLLWDASPAKRGDLSCGGVSSSGCSSCWDFVSVPPPAHSPVHRQGGVGRGGGKGWFVFPLLCLKIPPSLVPCETGLSPARRPVASLSLGTLLAERAATTQGLPCSCPPLPPPMLGTKVSQLSVSSPVL